MVIDSHAHLIFPLEKQVRLMKEAGVDKTILFPMVIHPEMMNNTIEFSTEIEMLNNILQGGSNPAVRRIEAINDVVKVIKENSGLFTGFGTCPVGHDYADTSGWIEDQVVSNGLAGVGEITFAAGEAIKTENIFRALSDYNGNLPLWIHTFNPATVDDIRTLISLADKYPEVDIIFGHGGGSWWFELITHIKNKRNVYYDISASVTAFQLQFASIEFPERVLFSSDAPYGIPLLIRYVRTFIARSVDKESLCALLPR